VIPAPAAPAALPPEAVPPEAQAAVERARAAYARMEPFEAVAELERAVALAPSWAEAQRFLGKLQLQLSSVWFGTPTVDRGRLELATRALLRAHELEPGHADGCYWAGRALVLGERPEAEGLLRDALRLDPRHGLAAKELGLLLAAAGDVARARIELERAEGLLPDDNEVPFHLGLQLESEGDLDGALAAHRRSLALNPAHEGPRTRLVSLLQRKGEDAEADRQAAELERWRAFGEELRRAMDRARAEPHATGPMLAVAELYAKAGMLSGARDWAERALQRDPEDARVQQLMAELGARQSTEAER
jgi:tetratricopeptide (TPR) repeat protein